MKFSRKRQKNKENGGKYCEKTNLTLAALLVSIAAASFAVTGCGKNEKAEETTASETLETSGGYEDNFAVDSKAAAEFADKIKEAVAAKDLEALADLTAFPVYVDIENANEIKTRDEFIALGADVIFTEGLMNSVANADTENMQPSMAGFSVSDGGSANVNFGVRDGVLAVNGINY